MPVSVTQDVYDYLAGERNRFQQQADTAQATRDQAEAARLAAQRFADDMAEVVADMEVNE